MERHNQRNDEQLVQLKSLFVNGNRSALPPSASSLPADLETFKGNVANLEWKSCNFGAIGFHAKSNLGRGLAVRSQASTSAVVDSASAGVRFRLDNLGPQPGSRKNRKRKGRITGAIPKEIGLLSKMVFLDLSENRLTGPIPDEIGNCTALQMLNLSNNTLGRTLPNSLSTLSRLQSGTAKIPRIFAAANREDPSGQPRRLIRGENRTLRIFAVPYRENDPACMCLQPRKGRGLAVRSQASTSAVVDSASAGVRFRLDNLGPQPGSRKNRKRKGRGHAAGQGGSCGFGMRGQKSRSGPGVRKGFEGGPLYRRLLKLRGIAESVKTEGEDVSLETLKERGLINPSGRERKLPLKILGDGDFNIKLNFKARSFSTAAKEKLEFAGCILTELPGRKKWMKPSVLKNVARAEEYFAKKKAAAESKFA
uniref:Large ribosomal subunit protein uL15/eL18 domain-containing protein n=1 Tax=Kalanchoe fedtschenkoi TaxID=63787 RepID=A0A7N0UZ54_KALFE